MIFGEIEKKKDLDPIFNPSAKKMNRQPCRSLSRPGPHINAKNDRKFLTVSSRWILM